MRTIRIFLKSPAIIAVIFIIIVFSAYYVLKELGIMSLNFFEKKKKPSATASAESADTIGDMAKASKIEKNIKKMSKLIRKLTR